MEIVARFADRVLAFYDGTVIADGTPAVALADPRVQTFISGTRPSARGDRAPCLSVSGLDVSIGAVPIIRNASLALAKARCAG